MKKRLLPLFGIAGILALAVLIPNSSIAGARDQNDLRAFAGNWGCSFTSPISFFGPIAGIATLNIDPTGRVVGDETVASGEPFVLLELEITGQVREGPNGTINGSLTITHPSFAPQTGRIRCVGTTNRLGEFQAMSYLDLNDEPGGTGGTGPSTDQVSLLHCARQ